MTEFDKQKSSVTQKVDLSKKSSIDEKILDVITYINSLENLFTTSSCSGRIIVFENNDGEIKKKGCKWLLASHDKIQTQQLMIQESLQAFSQEIRDGGISEQVECLKDSHGDAVLKFEPFVLHVQCRDIPSAQCLHSCAVSAGFRNSGLSIAKRGKIISAVRSTHSLEVPLTHNGNILVSAEYLEYITDLANNKMDENIQRVQRFFDNIKNDDFSFEADGLQKKHIKQKHPHKRAECTEEKKGLCDENSKLAEEKFLEDQC